MDTLFGEKVTEQKKAKGKYSIYREKHNYRIGNKTNNCRNCEHIERFEYHNKVYSKCLLQGTSKSSVSDIKLKNVCDNFKED